MRVIEIETEEQFRELVFDYEKETEWKFKGDKNTLVDFYADFCMPCKMMIKDMENANDKDEFNIYKVNSEKLPQIASVFGVQTVPYLMFINASDKTKNPLVHTGAIPVTKIIEHLTNI